MERIAYVVIGGSVGVVLTVALQTTAAMDRTAMAGTGRGDMAVADTAAMGADHRHPPREVAAGARAPGVTHLVFPDAMDGYDVQILARDFAFAPAAIDREVRENEGHAHVYVKGVKIARVYGDWVHLPAALFRAGENEVRVTLNANDHSEWTSGGEPIASTVRVVRAD